MCDHWHLCLVNFISIAQSCLILCDPMDCSMPGFPVYHQLPELTQTRIYWVSDAFNHLILCFPLLLPPSIFPSIRVFSIESVLRIRGPKYWGFSYSLSPSNEYSGLISFRIDWFDLLAIQGTLKSLRQHHSSKTSIFRCSAFFMVQLSHPYTTTGKTIANQYVCCPLPRGFVCVLGHAFHALNGSFQLCLSFCSGFQTISKPAQGEILELSHVFPWQAHRLTHCTWLSWASLVAQSVKNLPAMQEAWVRFLTWEDHPGEGNGYPLQYSCLENPVDRGAW